MTIRGFLFKSFLKRNNIIDSFKNALYKVLTNIRKSREVNEYSHCVALNNKLTFMVILKIDSLIYCYSVIGCKTRL